MTHFPVAKFSLAKREPKSRGLICDEHGLTLGPAQLIFPVRNAAGERSFRVAKPQWLADVLAVAYAPPPPAYYGDPYYGYPAYYGPAYYGPAYYGPSVFVGGRFRVH